MLGVMTRPRPGRCWRLAGCLVALVFSTGVAAKGLDQAMLEHAVEVFPTGCDARYPDLQYRDRALVRTLYEQREFEPLWRAPRRRAQLVEQLRTLAGDGLSPDWYGAGLLASAVAYDACLEVLASAAYLSALRDVRFGRLTRDQQDPLWVNPDLPPANEESAWITGVARQALAARKPALAFDRARPTHRLYRQLREAYLWVLRQSWESWTPVPEGPLIRPGDEDVRVPALRARLQAQGYLAAGTQVGLQTFVHEAGTAEAIRRFQRDHGLKSDGIVGPETLVALNITLEDRIDQLRINLERLRWLLPQDADNLLVVDIAGAEVAYYQHDALLWQARAIVGRPGRPTPSLVSRMSRLTFNPFWTVPPTILRKDKLPEIRKDIGYLAKNHLRVLDFDGRELDPGTIDWHRPAGILLRQDPGPWNALGRVAFRFPNPFAVYLHDTPDQHLFEQATRALSSGCVRVENAMTLADILLQAPLDRGFEHQAEALRGNRTHNKAVAADITLLMGYWTAEGRDDGTVQFRPDIYDRDQAMLAHWRRQAANGITALDEGG